MSTNYDALYTSSSLPDTALPVTTSKEAQSPASTATSESDKNRFAAIDGLRAVACLGVIFHHCFAHGGRYSFPEIHAGAISLSLPHGISYGFLGVEMFFVLSAFCLAYPMLAKQRPFDWKEYLIRRGRRILPPYYATFFLLMIGGLIIRSLHLEPFYSALFLQTTIKQAVLAIFFLALAYNASFWTLCLEARWYFALPFLVSLLRRSGWWVTFGVCCGASALFYFVYSSISPASKIGHVLALLAKLPFWLPTFGLGLLVAQMAVTSPDIVRHRYFVPLVRLSAILTAIAIPFFVPYLGVSVDPRRMILGSLLCFTIILLALFDKQAIRLLSHPLLVRVGIASYSIYLIHEPLIHFTYFLTAPLHWTEPIQFLWYQGVMPPLLVLIGMGWFSLIEKPLLQKRQAAKPVAVKAIEEEKIPLSSANAQGL